MKKLALAMIMFFPALILISQIAAGEDGQLKGENRLLNSGFEDDNPGEEPAHWMLEKGG